MNTWEIKVLVLLSFSAQFVLVFFASCKNYTNKKWLVMLISTIYFLANWVAPFALELFSNQQDCSRSCGPCPIAISGDFLAFWATFLLLHLGGPSNIASLSLDENDMWLKKVVELGSNVITATLVFSRATPSNLLFPASFLVLLVGTVKYAERTLTLFRGRSERWDSIAALVENTDLSQAEKNIPTDVQSVLGKPFDYDDFGSTDLSDKELLQLALCLYENFKGFIVGGVSYKPRLLWGVHALGCNPLEEFIARAMVLRRRWSNSLSRWNLIRIFKYLCKISEEAGENVRTAKEMCSARGNLAVMEFNCENLIGWSRWSGGVDYANSLMRWHIATDIFFRTNPNMNDVDSARLSEYLLYLFLWKPSIIAPTAGNWEPIFQHAYAEARQFFHEKSITDPTQACQALLSHVIDFDPALLSGGASESVWKDACRLAKQLISNFEDQRWWYLIRTVWMELLVYAAFNSKAITHIRQLGEGGEALTVVWLLMNHLGLGNNFSEAPVLNPV